MNYLAYIMLTAWFPAHKAVDVGKRYLEVRKKYPDDRSLAKRAAPPLVSRFQNGFKIIGIFKVKQGKLDELILRIMEGLTMLNDIEGYNYKIEPLISIEEAMPMLGLKPPE